MDAQAKQQIVERVKQASNILVTVSTDPSVDQLAACIGLTLMLNKMDKHATAVFSGKVPSTIEFLQPEKTLETNIDSLRDFIISLDKAKADKLRYKVEDQVVRIFITPYKTSLSEKDLTFAQGDFNVEAVIALGVKDKSQIDQAITAHGRILHDATVISINAGDGNAPQVGSINWQDANASSLSEMLVSISEAFGTGLIDNQMATAFLTGIVAETERFSNPKTSPKVMTMSAQLMAAGANQQLIASKLEPPAPEPLVPAIPAVTPPPPEEPKPEPPHAQMMTKPVVSTSSADGLLSVSHAGAKSDGGEVSIDPKEIRIDDQGNLKTANQLKAELEKPEDKAPALPAPEVVVPEITPAEAVKTDEAKLEPHAVLGQDLKSASFSGNMQPEWSDPDTKAPVDPLSETQKVEGLIGHSPAITPPPEKPFSVEAAQAEPAVPLSPTDKPGNDSPSVDNARSAVADAFSSMPFDPASNPVAALNARPLNPEPNNDQPPAQDGIAPVAPPPGPPPIMFDPNMVNGNGNNKTPASH